MTDYVIEADGGSRGNPGPAAYGTVVREAKTGKILVEIGEFIGNDTNNVAEYMGLVAGLRFVNAHDPHGHVEARLDSKLVVEQMTGRWRIKKDTMRSLALAARAAHPPESVGYVWVPRHQNVAADALVNECLDLAASGREATITRSHGGGVDAALGGTG